MDHLYHQVSHPLLRPVSTVLPLPECYRRSLVLRLVFPVACIVHHYPLLLAQIIGLVPLALDFILLVMDKDSIRSLITDGMYDWAFFVSSLCLSVLLTLDPGLGWDPGEDLYIS